MRRRLREEGEAAGHRVWTGPPQRLTLHHTNLTGASNTLSLTLGLDTDEQKGNGFLLATLQRSTQLRTHFQTLNIS